MKGGSSSNAVAQMPNSEGCNYTDGAQYVGCQVAARGWPSPSGMSGGKKAKLCRVCKSTPCTCKRRNKSRSVKRGGCGCNSMLGGKSRKRGKSRGKKGGFMGLVNEAIVPFGLFALQKRSQKRLSLKGGSKKSRKSRKSRRH